MRALLFISMLLSSVAVAAPLKIDLVSDYHILERSQTLLMHRDHVVLGRTGNQNEERGHIERFDPVSFKLLDSVGVDHEIRALYAVDDCRLFATGTEAYSVIDYCTSTPAVETRTVPMNMVAHYGAPLGVDGYLFSEPNAGLYKVSTTGAARRIGDHVSMTTAMQAIDQTIWVASYYNIWTIDAQSGARQELLPTDVYGEKQLFRFSSSTVDYLAASVEEEANLLFFDLDTGKIAAELALDTDPHKMATFGECLVIALGEEKRVDFVRFDGQRVPEVVASWDVTAAGDRLKLPTNIAVDAASGQVFLRSSYPCPLCSVTQSSLFAVSDPTGDTLASCQ